MTTETPEPVPLFEHFTLTYPSGTVIPSFYCGGATLREVQVTHPLARVEGVEGFLDSTRRGVPGHEGNPLRA